MISNVQICKYENVQMEFWNEMSGIVIGDPLDNKVFVARTFDGGSTWKVVYENKTKGMFLDAMEFWNLNSGIVIGDPINNKVFIARSFDGGITWKPISPDHQPVVDSGEAMFASSGTNVRKLTNQEAVIITGGLRSRLLIRDKKIEQIGRAHV